MKKCPKCNSSKWDGRYCRNKKCNFENTRKKEALLIKSNNDFIPMQLNEEEAEEIMEKEKELSEEELDNLLQ